MPTILSQPSRVQAAGNKPKLIDEYIGRLNSKNEAVSIAHMRSPGGWQESGQTPEFDEYSVVLRGMLRVEHRDGSIDVRAGSAGILDGNRASRCRMKHHCGGGSDVAKNGSYV